MNYESLIFDIDGTLWDSRALVAEGYNIQLKQEGLDHLCVDAEILKAQFTGGYTLANAVTGESISWDSTGYVNKTAIQYVIKEAN